MQSQNLLFYRTGRNESIDRYRALLTNAVGAVAGLVFDGRIPPRIQMNHIVGSGEVEAQSSGFQTDEKQRLRARLKLTNQSVALYGAGAAVQIEIVDAQAVEFLTDECQMAGKLTASVWPR